MATNQGLPETVVSVVTNNQMEAVAVSTDNQGKPVTILNWDDLLSKIPSGTTNIYTLDDLGYDDLSQVGKITDQIADYIINLADPSIAPFIIMGDLSLYPNLSTATLNDPRIGTSAGTFLVHVFQPETYYTNKWEFFPNNAASISTFMSDNFTSPIVNYGDFLREPTQKDGYYEEFENVGSVAIDSDTETTIGTLTLSQKGNYQINLNVNYMDSITFNDVIYSVFVNNVKIGFKSFTTAFDSGGQGYVAARLFPAEIGDEIEVKAQTLAGTGSIDTINILCKRI